MPVIIQVASQYANTFLAEKSPELSLLVIVSILGVTTIVSLLKKQKPHFPL